MAEQSLKEKTIRGVGWSAIDNVSSFAITFIVSIVLARLLSPDDYGLLGIIAIFTAVCNAIINGGFPAALIRKQNVTTEDYNTVFIVNLLVSVFLYAVIYYCAPLIADFFARQELVALTRVSSLGMIVGAFSMVQQTRLTKRIDFRTQTKISIIGSISSGVIGVAMALLGFGVWSLVAQQLFRQFIGTILLCIYNHWMPSLRFSLNSLRELFGFGWKLMVSNLLETIWKEFFQVIVGKFYSPATLGQYTRAKQFSQLLSSNLTGIVQRVTYPVLCDIQDDKTRMVSAYRRIIKMTMFITAVSMFALGAVSEPLLYCLIGPKWHEAAIILPLICINGTLYPLHAINLNMLQVQGRSDLFLVLEILRKIVGVGPLLVGIFVGIMPMLYVSLIAGVICFFINSSFSGKFLGYSSWAQLKDVAPSYGIALAVALSVFFLKYLPISNWFILPMQVFIGLMSFFVICRLTGIAEYYEIRALLLPVFQRIKKKIG